MGVDILMARSPPLVKDMYFDDVDMMLPYTEAAQAYKKKTYRGSVHDMMSVTFYFNSRNTHYFQPQLLIVNAFEREIMIQIYFT